MITRYRKYEHYVDSSCNWIGKIPSHWNTLNGQFIFRVINERSKTGQEMLLSVSERKGVTPRSEANVTMFMAESYIGYKLCKKGDLVINSLWAWSKGLGFSEYEGIVSTAYSVYRPDHDQFEYRFLHYLLRTKLYVDQFRISSKGIWTSRLQLHDWTFLRIPIVFPGKQEQKSITNFLDTKTQQIDHFIQLKEKTIALLQERKAALINQAVTCGLDENGQLRERPASLPATGWKDSGIEWLGAIPEGWEVTRINRIIKVKDGTHDTPDYVDKDQGGIPFVTSKDFKRGQIDFSNVKYIDPKVHQEFSKRSDVKKGDIIMSMIGGNIGNLVLVKTEREFSIKNVALFKTCNNTSQAKHLRFILKSKLLKIQIDLNSKGGAQGFLSLSDIRNLKYISIPNQEMDSIVDFLCSNEEIIDQRISREIRKITLIKEYRSSLISAAVTGKIDVRDYPKTPKVYVKAEND